MDTQRQEQGQVIPDTTNTVEIIEVASSVGLDKTHIEEVHSLEKRSPCELLRERCIASFK